jgi:hypothetical protein
MVLFVYCSYSVRPSFAWLYEERTLNAPSEHSKICPSTFIKQVKTLIPIAGWKQDWLPPI